MGLPQKSEKVWNAPAPDNFRSAQELQVFSFDEGRTYVDLMEVAPWKQLRNDVVVWGHCGESDIDGCLCLSEPQKATINLALEDDRYPILLMLKELHLQHFTPTFRSSMAQSVVSASLYNIGHLFHNNTLVQC